MFVAPEHLNLRLLFGTFPGEGRITLTLDSLFSNDRDGPFFKGNLQAHHPHFPQ
jgi:hypothetical protein